MPHLPEIRPLVVLALTGLLAGCSSAPATPPPTQPAATGGSNTGGTPAAMAGGGSGGAAAPTAGTGGATATSGAGGTGGDLGTAGTGGGLVTAGTGGGGATLKTGMSAGCGMQVVEEPGAWTQHQITPPGVDATAYPDDVNRVYYTQIFGNYDANTPWPVFFYGPGCGGNFDNNAEGFPALGSLTNNAVVVFLAYTSNCFKSGGMDSPEIPYFEAVLNEMEANYCIDKSKIFLTGYSSGGWLTNLLSCSHSDRIRAIGTAAGGLGAEHPPCKTNGLAAIYHASTNDGANPIVNIDDNGIDEGSGAARDRVLALNGCDMPSAPWVPAGEAAAPWDFCGLYPGCDNANDVVWCEEPNVGHSNGGDVAAQGWWQFMSALPPP